MKIKNVLIYIPDIIFVLLLVYYFESKNNLFVYMIGFFFLYAIYRVWKSWEQVMIIIRYVETVLYGKPLDKGMWEKGELKQAKQNRKFVWKKEDGKKYTKKKDGDKYENDELVTKDL